MIFFLHSTFGIYIQHVVHRLAILLVQAVGFFSLKQRSPNSHECCNFTLSNSVLQVQSFSKLPFGNLKQIGCQLQILAVRKKGHFLKYHLEGTLTSQGFIPRQIRIKETIQ